MATDDVLGREMHRRQIQRPGTVPDEGSQGRGTNGVGGDAVLIRLPARTMASVKVGWRCFRCKDTDARREQVVQSALQVGARNWGIQRERCDLPEGVNSGICPTGALRENGFSGDLSNRCSDSTLYGRKAGLNLPAMIAGTVIGNGELPV